LDWQRQSIDGVGRSESHVQVSAPGKSINVALECRKQAVSLDLRLDLWLLVMLWAWLVDLLLQIVPVLVERFSVGYYFGRVYGLLSTMVILSCCSWMP
jgi:hypothetical protein